MNRPQTPPPSPGLKPGDILHILFRHKWKILIITALGVIGAAVLPLIMPAPWQSEAKLLIRYVVESKSPTQVGPEDGRVKSPDIRGETVIGSELEILTSYDLAYQVADIVGPQKILAAVGGGDDRTKAAFVVHAGVMAEVPRNSSVIRLTFEHRDAQLVQPVLSQIIESYLKKHAEIHAGGAFDDFLTQETDQLRNRLSQTEEELRKAKAKAGVISLDDTKKLYTEQISRIRQEIYAGQAELAERQTSVTELARLLNISLTTNGVPANTNTTNVAATTAAVSNAAPVVAGPPPVPSDKIAEYRRVSAAVEMFGKRHQELSFQFAPESSRVKAVYDQLVAAEKQKAKLEQDYPGLLAVQVAETKNTGNVPVDPNQKNREMLAAESARSSALVARIKVLTEQLEDISKEATAVYGVEGGITELQRKKDLEEQHFRYFSANLEQNRIDERLGQGKISNISKIQAPSPPYRDTRKLQKAQLGALFGALALALGFAFVLEMFLDPTIKRPEDIQVKVGLPMFMSIPKLALRSHAKGNTKALKAPTAGLLTNATGTDQSPEARTAVATTADAQSAVALDIPPWSPEHVMRPYAEALRDRLINFFEVNNMTHKPKLVAVTSCGEGVGVSSVAAGLAASLSETGEGNVLLVDMNEADGAAHQFHKGDLAFSIDDALEKEKRDGTMLQDHLYRVSEDTTGRDRLPSMLPKRFKNLVPKLKASDYDYIIFDMPPVSQVSLTPRLARFMDMTLIVAEAEKTSKDVLKQAGALLGESKTNIGVVLNKSKTYVPKRLIQEL